MNAPWSDNENRALVVLYFYMLDAIRAGTKINKRAEIRHAQLSGDESLGNRSRQSVEAKLMNATAAHIALRPDAETMSGHGYRPLARFQASLKDAMRREIERRESHTGPDSADLPARKATA